jgi:hypothetical protein
MDLSLRKQDAGVRVQVVKAGNPGIEVYLAACNGLGQLFERL